MQNMYHIGCSPFDLLVIFIENFPKNTVFKAKILFDGYLIVEKKRGYNLYHPMDKVQLSTNCRQLK